MKTKLTEYVANRNLAKRNRISFVRENYSAGDDFGGGGVRDTVAF